MSRLVDSFGRKHTYLRISVTDRCNLRCVYCMPPEGIQVRPKDEILTLEEIERLARVLVRMGITKIRLTGGEPLVRHGLPDLVQRLRRLEGLQTLAMTTNGVLLEQHSETLKNHGLDALNISLDTLRKERFIRIALRDDFEPVMRGIEAALRLRFDTIKLNVVVIKGVNDDEIMDFVDFVADKPMNIRFIEYMPFKDNNWSADGVFGYKEMREVVEQKYSLAALSTPPGAVAKDFAIEGRTGTVSFITSMTDSFCSSCNRLRVTADGSIKSCLFYAPELNVRDALRGGASVEELERVILDALWRKPEAHPPMEELASADNRAMVEIGG